MDESVRTTRWIINNKNPSTAKPSARQTIFFIPLKHEMRAILIHLPSDIVSDFIVVFERLQLENCGIHYRLMFESLWIHTPFLEWIKQTVITIHTDSVIALFLRNRSTASAISDYSKVSQASALLLLTQVSLFIICISTAEAYLCVPFRNKCLNTRTQNNKHTIAEMFDVFAENESEYH